MSEADYFVVREATAADMPGISHVRLSVKENALSVQQLTARGITNASVAASLLTHRRGWVAERSGEIVAFSMADKGTGRSSRFLCWRNMRGGDWAAAF